MKKKINISFIQYGGMTYRTMIELACRLDKKKFNVVYFWCLPGVDKFSGFKHPIPTNEDIKLHKSNLVSNGVLPIEFKVQNRFIPDPNLPWENTNFWQLFDEVKTDVVFTWRGGRQEYPFCHINKPIVDWNVFGFFDPTFNVFKTLAISPYCLKENILNGNLTSKVEVAFLPLNEFKSKLNLRKELGISEDTIVVGMHQRVEDTIFDPHSLNAIKYVTQNSKIKLKIIFLGGSKKYEKYSKSLKLDGIFLEATKDYSYVSKFLNTLDIYTHARKDGETLGAAIQEAMIHSLPVLSHKSQWNAHIDTLGPGGIVCENQNDYNKILLSWVENLEKAKDFGEKGFQYALNRYSWKSTISIIENVFLEAANMNLKGWLPVKLSIYKKRKILYFLRHFILSISTFILIKLFGQKASVFPVKAKQRIKNLLKRTK